MGCAEDSGGYCTDDCWVALVTVLATALLAVLKTLVALVTVLTTAQLTLLFTVY